MAKKPKKPSAGPCAARQRAAAAQSGPRSRGDFGLAALREVTSSNAFTMKDEARNTGHRASLWAGDTRLRARPIGFVSAGLIEPLEEKPQDEQDDESPKETSEAGISMEDATHQPPIMLPIEEHDLPVETAGQSLESSRPSPSPDATAAALTAGTSASDVVVPEPLGFVIDVTGEKTLAANLPKPAPCLPDLQSSADEGDSSSSEVILFKGRNNTSLGRGPAQQKPKDSTLTLDTIRLEVKAVEAENSRDTDEPSSHATRSSARSRRRDRRVKPQDVDDEEEAIIADYIANMAEDSDDADEPRQPFLGRDLGADDGGFSSDTSSESSALLDDTAASGDDQEDETSMGRDVLGGQGSDDDDMASPTMDDETLARLLAKQEELGMGSDELILASAAAGGRGSAYYGNNSRKSRRGYGADNRNPGGLPSASSVADAFDDLDLMDWERPSLQNQRKRGRRGQAPVFGLSDSELEQTLQTAWQNDRESKKSRKMRREQLRAQGLLGKHANPEDPRLRYPHGMTLEDIKAEMRSFLEGSEARLELPPMDKWARATLHELARKFKVKSQSTGSGNQRRPTLIRTKYTASFAEEHLEIAISRLGRKHFPRLDLKGKGKVTQRNSRAGAGHSAVTYQEGEIVGASAPELGQENKGRAMLEKMGWSSGMGLGSMENKGILQPVAHVVKRTKAGLG